MATKLTTAQRGYGGNHVKARDRLIYNLVEGSECEYCGRPMYTDKTKNFDGASLEADHIDRDKTQPPKRLIHRQCNRKLNGNGAGKWVKHGPEWYAKHGQNHGDNGLDWPGGRVIVWPAR